MRRSLLAAAGAMVLAGGATAANAAVVVVYYGGFQSSAGPFENQAILIERANRIFGGDCCIFYRVETLSFRKDGLISKIKRSAELDLELKPDGHVPWEQPRTP